MDEEWEEEGVYGWGEGGGGYMDGKQEEEGAYMDGELEEEGGIWMGIRMSEV